MSATNPTDEWKRRCEELERLLQARDDAIAYFQRVSSETAQRSLRRSNDLVIIIEERNRAVADAEGLLLEKQRLIEQLRVLNGQLAAMANTDPLTGVCNRRRVVELLESEIRRQRRYESKISVVLFDIDHFKAFNDTHGHLIGDEVLKHTCHLVRRNIRGTDTLGRYGGEEFLLLLPETQIENAVNVARKLCNIIRETPLTAEHRKLCVTASFGVTNCSTSDTVETILNRADQAMYAAKMHGRDCIMTTLIT
jgi:diguanylate cyclase (GGDEF)-like protein